MIHGNMTRYSSGRKKKYNAWTSKSEASKHNSRPFVEYQPKAVYRRGDTSHIPSLDVSGGSHDCSRPAKQEYTGTLIKGISTMHKSNAVPIINAEEAKEHANMRR